MNVQQVCFRVDQTLVETAVERAPYVHSDRHVRASVGHVGGHALRELWQHVTVQYPLDVIRPTLRSLRTTHIHTSWVHTHVTISTRRRITLSDTVECRSSKRCVDLKFLIRRATHVLIKIGSRQADQKGQRTFCCCWNFSSIFEVLAFIEKTNSIFLTKTYCLNITWHSPPWH